MKLKKVSGIMLTIFLTSMLGIWVRPVISQMPGMVSYWRLDEDGGTTAYDSVGYNDGTLINGPTWTTGQVEGALNFTGNNYVDCGTDASLDMVEEVTVIAWVKRGSLSSYPDLIVAKGRSIGVTYENYNLWIFQHRPADSRSDKAAFGYQLSDGRFGVLWSTTLIVDLEKWYFLVGTFCNGTAKIYVDGMLENSAYFGDVNLQPTPNPLRIGYDYYYNHPSFIGLIDEVAIYNRALSLEEIQQHHQNGLAGLHYDENPWEYNFEDPYRCTELRINTDNNYFQFITPDKEFQVKQAQHMSICEYEYATIITIWHMDNEIMLIAFALDSRFDFCVAYARDMQTGQNYLLIDKPDYITLD